MLTSHPTYSAPFPLIPPLPIPILAEEICKDQDKTCTGNAARYASSLDTNDDKYIDMKEAQGFVEKLKYGYHPALKTDKAAQLTFSTIRRIFFADSPFNEKHSTITPFVFGPNTVWFADGDTFSINLPFGEKSVRFSFRFAGIDTPESIWRFPKNGKWIYNSKLVSQVDFSWKYFSRYAGIPKTYEPIAKQVIRERVMYLGLLAGSTTKGMAKWAKEKNIPFNVGPSFDRVRQEPEMANSIVIADIYGRTLGVPRIGLPGEKQNYIAFFIANILPKIMADEGMKHYNHYQGENVGAATPEGKDLLKRLGSAPNGSKPHAVWEALSPATLLNPEEIYSQENCRLMAERWIQFVRIHPEYRNDIQAMLVFTGLAFAYPKYRTQHTDAYLKAEGLAMGPLQHGLWGDKMFRILQPNPTYSPLYREFGKEISPDRELLPADACEVLEKAGKDIHDHCE